MKKCSKCGEDKPKTSFCKDKTRTDGLFCWCRSCRSSHEQIRYHKKPGLKEKVSGYARERYGGNKEATLWKHRMREFGVTQERFNQMLANQGGGCAICKTSTPRGHGKFHIDHDHSTGMLRGILCPNCNTGIGILGDDVERLRAAADYLEVRRGVTTDRRVPSWKQKVKASE